jgi:hypothetical protein
MAVGFSNVSTSTNDDKVSLREKHQRRRRLQSQRRSN